MADMASVTLAELEETFHLKASPDSEQAFFEVREPKTVSPRNILSGLRGSAAIPLAHDVKEVVGANQDFFAVIINESAVYGPFGPKNRTEHTAVLEFRANAEARGTYHLTHASAFGQAADGDPEKAQRIFNFVARADEQVRRHFAQLEARHSNVTFGNYWTVNSEGTGIDLQALGREFGLVP